MSQEQFVERKGLAYYRQCFTELNVSSSRQRGNAHYKPLLLLSVIDLIAQKIIQENRIIVSDELIDVFNMYWDILASDSSYKGGLHYPFFHLQSEGFWHLEFKPSFNGLQPKTTNKLREAVEYAYLDTELFDLLQDSITRTELIDTIVAVWFSSNQKKLEDILQINAVFQNSIDEEVKTLEEERNFDADPKIILRKSYVRNAFFRKSIVQLYDYRCAFCRLRVTRKLTQNIVDGAHIKPFAEFLDSKINNGISLCKNHHWAFDQYWFTINDEYKIVVASNLEEDAPNTKPMREFHGETILLPSSEQDFPSIESLQWHQSKFNQRED